MVNTLNVVSAFERWIASATAAAAAHDDDGVITIYTSTTVVD